MGLLKINGFITVGVYLFDENKDIIHIINEKKIPVLNNFNNTQIKNNIINEKKIENYNKKDILINRRIRSGQQIFSKNGSVIVLSKISSDAEIIANNNIYVYGTLKGRAIAGAYGNIHAKIFCNKLEAYLVSIAGKYKLLEKNYDYSYRKNVNITGFYIYLKDNRILIKAIEDD